MILADFTKPEIEYLIEQCNFTPEQEQFFLLRCKNISIEQCAESMNISISTANNLSRKVKQKILKIL